MADHPLRPATDRRLGEPLPHQLANPTSAAPKAQGPKIPCFPAHRICGISVTFATLSPTSGHVPMHYSPVRHSPSGASTHAAVRLACVRHAASVQSEPGSNSSVQSLLKLSLDVLQIISDPQTFYIVRVTSSFSITPKRDQQDQEPTPINRLVFKELATRTFQFVRSTCRSAKVRILQIISSPSSSFLKHLKTAKLTSKKTKPLISNNFFAAA